MNEYISKLKKYFVCLVIVLAITGCKKADDKEARPDMQSKKVLARVDGGPIYEDEIVRRIKVAHGIADKSTVDPDRWQKMVNATLESEIVDRLLLKAAIAEGMVADSNGVDQLLNKSKTMLGEEKFQEMLNKRGNTEAEYREFLEERSLIKQYREKLFAGISIDDEELRRYYEDHEQSFVAPGKVRMEILAAKKPEDADEMYQKVEAGEDFQKVAQEYSQAGKEVFFGKTALMSVEAVPLAIQLQVKGGHIGDVIAPAKIDNSFNMYKILEKQQSRVLTYEEVEERIRNLLLQRKQRTFLEDWATSAKQETTVEYIR